MDRSKLLKISAVLLFVIAVVMVYFGTKKNMLPPILTGLGFVIISTVFLNLGKASKP